MDKTAAAVTAIHMDNAAAAAMTPSPKYLDQARMPVNQDIVTPSQNDLNDTNTPAVSDYLTPSRMNLIM